MGGQTQRHYQHALPKTARPLAERINLTFRWIAPS
jgi:alkylated DNA repair dioxygenase AlkB